MKTRSMTKVWYKLSITDIKCNNNVHEYQTPSNRVFLEELAITQLVYKFPTLRNPKVNYLTIVLFIHI
jgi:hypothetical protein